ncbi:MAG TPA: hypothetical protein VMF30_18685 [Pirellulales bacterium]|nr:hypothetical protein [Pirellulales bacterium]
MAREEEPRENLIAEATALVERVELLASGQQEPIVAGFRREGSLSLFFGDDPVYQFNAARQLRRAYVGGRLYKAAGGRLLEITRERDAARLHLASRELTPAESARFVAGLQSLLDGLATKLRGGQVQVVATVPSDADVVGRLELWLAEQGAHVEIALTPNAR